MKIRNGFVSNSSSSSFILKFDKIPETVEETRILLYGENPPTLTAHYGDEAILTEQVAKIVHRDITETVQFGVRGFWNQFQEEIREFDEYNYHNGLAIVKGTKYEDEFETLYKKIIEIEGSGDKWKDYTAHSDKLKDASGPIFDIIEKVIFEKYTEDDVFISTDYGDEGSGIYAYLEHGPVLSKFTVQRFSHH